MKRFIIILSLLFVIVLFVKGTEGRFRIPGLSKNVKESAKKVNPKDQIENVKQSAKNVNPKDQLKNAASSKLGKNSTTKGTNGKSEWSKCSKTCGTGVQYRTHGVLSVKLTRKCSTRPCANKFLDFFSWWSSWGPCSVTCGSGHKSRSRKCMIPNTCNKREEMQSCKSNPCKNI
ncbi:uncharacterized protein LOC120347577 [Styela clava]